MGSQVLLQDEESVRGRAWLPALFGLTAFVGASLLFVVQPLVARLLLPSYGGSATVWSTSSLFFQVLLLAGYLYTHWSTRLLGPQRQPLLQMGVLLLPLLLSLPLTLPGHAAPDAERSPILWLLWVLLGMIGLPFAVVATAGPLLQRWYSWTGGPGAEDPYFLFAASNLGSFGGLLAYPFLIEPVLSLDQQRLAWSWGFGLFTALTVACGVAAMRGSVGQPMAPVTMAGLGRTRLLTWLWWAFLPSALMLAITAHIATDVASLPLLWVVPLAIYLATFVVAFSSRSRSHRSSAIAARAGVAVTFVLALTGLAPGIAPPVAFSVLVAMLVLAVVGYAAHRRLAADRPDPEQLTTFYVVIAVGGALGGLLNGLLAPLLLDRVLEYPVLLALVPLLVVGTGRDSTSLLDRFATRSPAAWAGVLVLLLGASVASLVLQDGARPSGMTWLFGSVLLGVLLFRTVTAPVWMVSGLILLGGLPLVSNQLHALDQSRTFYGAYRVFETSDSHVIVHGTTLHGAQFLDERATQPIGYYDRTGPLGDAFELLAPGRVGVVGLGAGTIAAYAGDDMEMTFVEIDPEVLRIARDPALFTYLRDARGDVDVLIGDGRLVLDELPAGSFDLLVLDAFSSDAIPVHLLTHEAMAGYASRLAPGGVLMVHVSNRVFDLRPVLAGAARDTGLVGVRKRVEAAGDRWESDWVALTVTEDSAARFTARPGWEPLDVEPIDWTDDRASILDVLR